MNQRNIQHRTPNAEHRMASRILAHFGVREFARPIRRMLPVLRIVFPCQRHSNPPPLLRELVVRERLFAVQRITHGDGALADVEHGDVVVEQERESHQRERVARLFQVGD